MELTPFESSGKESAGEAGWREKATRENSATQEAVAELGEKYRKVQREISKLIEDIQKPGQNAEQLSALQEEKEQKISEKELLAVRLTNRGANPNNYEELPPTLQ